MTMGMVPPLATLLGGHLHVHLGWQAPFFLMSAFALLLLVAAWRGLLLALAAGLSGWHSPWALALPLMVLGVGHGLIVPSALAGSVGLVPAMAGAAAAVAGLMQQMSGALGGYAVGLVPHYGSVNLSLLMIGWALFGVAAQAVLFKRLRPEPLLEKPAARSP
jgi:DHA1 family bicyclomycin/chloramphenicol resistance-like MFS transporter